MSLNATPKSLWRVFIVVLSCMLLAFLPASDAYAQRTYANSQSNSVSGLCVLCGVTTPNNPVVNTNLDDYSQFNITVGLLGVSVQQVLNFPAVNPNAGCDSLVIGIGSGASLLAANLLGGVTFTTYNGNNTTPLETFNGSASLLRLLAATDRGEVILRPTQQFDRVRITLSSALVGALSNFRVYYAYHNQVNLLSPTIITGSSISSCSGNPVTLQASTTTPGATIAWYDAAVGGNQIPTPDNPLGTTLTVSPTVTTTYYAQVFLDNCTNATRSAITVNVNPLPATPVLSANNQIICGGQTTTFSVDAPAGGVTYNWYTVPSGGTAVGSGTTFTTPALNSTTVYYAEAALATGCASASRAVATATVNPTPANPVVNVPNITVQGGQTGSFTIQNPDPSATYTWYNLTTGGTALATGTTFTTPVLYATTSYYVEARSNQGCISAARTPVTANVNVQNNVPCSFATTQTSPIINGVCLLCSVTDGALAVDTDTASASTITATVSALGFVGQLVSFPNTYAAGDSIIFVVEAPGTLLGAGLLSSIQVESYTGNTPNGDAILLNSGLINLRLIAGTNKYRVAIPAQNSFNGARIAINGAVAALSQLKVYYAAAGIAHPVPVTAAVDVCSGSSAALTVTAPAGATVNWYDAPVGGNLLAANTTSYTTPALTASQTYYVVSGKFGCENGLRIPIEVTVNIPPAVPAVTADNIAVCTGDSATFVANSPAGVTFNWYTDPTGGIAIATGNTFTTPGLSANTTYYVEAVNNGCSSTSRLPVTVTINAAPAAVTVTPPSASIIVGQTASFTASSVTPGVSFNWFTQVAGGTSIFTGTDFTTPPLTTNTTYYVEAVSGANGCNSITRTPAVVTVGGGNNNDVPCDVATAETNAVGGVCLLCAVNNPQLAIDTDTQTGTDLRVGVGLLGAYSQQTLIFPSAGNAGDTIQFAITTPGSLADLGLLSTIQAATYNGATYNNDRQALNGGLLSLSLLADNRTTIVKFVASAAYDRVEVRLNSGVAGALTSVYLNYASRTIARPAFQQDTVTICNGRTASLVVSGPAGATFNWYTTATGGTPFFTGASYQTPVLTTDTAFYVESVRTTSGCANPVRSVVRVVVAPDVAPPTVAAANVTVCAGSSATLTATGPAGATFNWYAQQTGGTVLATGNSYTTTALDSSVIYYVESVNVGGCASGTRTAVQVNVTSVPPAPAVNPNAPAVCAGGTVTLSATSTVPGAIIKWYTTATADSAIATGTTFTTPALTTTTTFYAGVDAGQCSSTSRTPVTVTVNARPAAPTVTINPPGGLVNYGETATFTATSVTPGVTYAWYTDSTGGAAVSTGATFTTPALTNTTTYYVEVTSGTTGCTSATRTAVTINVNRDFNPGCDVANAQTNAIDGLCVLCSVTAPDNAVDNDLTNYSTINLPLALLAGSASQTLIFPTVTGPGDTVRLKLEIPGSVINAGVLGAITIGSYNGATFNNDALSLDDAPVRVDLLGGATGQAIISFVPGASFDRVRITLDAGLASAFRNLRIYYANRLVGAPVVTPKEATICAGSTATFTATAPAAATINWYDVPSGGTPLATGTSFTTPVLNSLATYYVESVRTANGCANPLRTIAMVKVLPVPQAPAIISGDTTICSGQVAVLRARSADGNQLRWYTAAVGGNLLSSDSIYTTPALTATITYYVEANNGTCANSGARTAVTVTVGANIPPPVVDNPNQSICAGSTVTLNIVTPGAGITYNWYTALTGGTPVATGASFTTPVLNSSTIYYVEAVGTTGGCTGSGARTQAVINVTATPAIPVVINATPVTCVGKSASFSIQNPVAGITYTWYSSATGGTPLAIGTSYTSGALTGDTTFYVSATNSNNCSSASRASVSVTVNATPNTPTLTTSNVTICSGNTAALSVANPDTAVTYTWYSAAVGGTVVATGPTFTTPVLTATTAYYVEASQPGGCVSNARAVATVSVAAIPTVPVVSADTTVCGSQRVRLAVLNPQVGIAYRWYTAATGGTLLAADSVFFTTPVLSATATYYVEAASGSCASTTREAVTITVNPAPANVTLVTSNLSACTGSTVTLNVQNPVAGTTYSWYAAATGGTALASGTSFTTPVLLVNTTYYVEASLAGGCTSTSRTAATITVNTLPAPPVITGGGTICSGSRARLAVQNPITGVAYRWYNAAVGGTLLAADSVFFTTPVLTANTTYYVEAFGGTCSSITRTAVTVTVGAVLDSVRLTAANVSVCSGGTATLSVQNPQPGVTYTWYGSPTGGTALATGATFTTPAVTSTTNYYVGATQAGGCSSNSRSMATVTVTSAPATPAVIGGGTVCAGATAVLSIQNPQAGVTYTWYATATGGTALATGNTFTTPAVTTATTYYAQAALSGGCVSTSRGSATVTPGATLATPVVTGGGTVCNGNTATLTIQNPVAGITYTWYASVTGGTALATGTTFTTPAVTATTTYYVEASQTGGCVSGSRGSATVTPSSVLVTPVVTGGGAVCSGNTATLSIQNPVVGVTYTWYASATGGTVLGTGTAFVTPAVTATATYYAQASQAGGCVSASRGSATVTVAASLATPVITGGGTVCNGSAATLSIQNPVGGVTYTWYATATGGTALATGTTFTTPAITGSATYYAEASQTGGCVSATRGSATVTAGSVLVTPVVTGGGAVCNGNTATLNIQNPVAGVTYTWYATATGGTALATGTTFTTPAVTASAIYYAEASQSGGCVSAARGSATVTVAASLATPVVTGGGAVCNGSTTILTVQNPVGGVTYTWYATATGGTALATGTTFTTPAVVSTATYYVEASQTGGCVSATRGSATVTVAAAPASPAISGGTTICSGNRVRLAVQSPAAGVAYRWYTAAAGGTLLAADSVFFTTPVLTSSTTYYVEAATGTCTSVTRTPVTITVTPGPGTVTLVAANVSACTGNSVTLSVSNPQPGFTYRWYTAATGGTLAGTGADFTTPSLTANTTYYVEAMNAGNCSSPSRTTATVTIVAGPTPPAVTSSDVLVCRGSTATLNVASPSTSLIYRWYSTSSGGAPLFTGPEYITGALNANTTFYVDAATTTGSCVSTTRAAVTVTVADAPATPVLVNGGNVTNCSGNTVTFSVQNPLPNVTYRWFDAPANGNLVTTGSSFTTAALTANATFYVEAVIGGNCTSSGRATATATISTTPANPVVSGNDFSLCPNSRDTLTATSTTAGVIFRWYSSATATTPVFTGATFITPLLNAATTYYVDASLTGGCTSAQRTAVTVTVLAVLPMPTVTVLDTEPTYITFQWNAIPGAIAYQVSTDGGITVVTPSSGLTGTTHTVTNLTPNQTVTLTVRAIGATACANSGWFLGASGTSDNPGGDQVFVPNAFTPNNDGVNDILYAYGNTISSVAFRIFNQWGQLVFESKDRARGWDGTMSGQKQPVGVYTYELNAVLQNGTKVNKRGTITLIR